MELEHRTVSDDKEARVSTVGHMEEVMDDKAQNDSSPDLLYSEDDEPEIGFRTYVALLAIAIMLGAQSLSLQGPPAALTYIVNDLGNPGIKIWIPNSLSLVQALLGPIMASVSDLFQARKTVLVGSSVISLIGCAIAPGSKDIYRLIAAQTLIGFGFAVIPVSYVVPSEILPRKWRPAAQAILNIVSGLSAIGGTMAIGAFTKADLKNGWRNFYWISTGMWAAVSLGLFFGYRPPKRHTRLDHLSFWQKIGSIDLLGFSLLSVGLALFLVGLTMGGNIYPWKNATVLSTIIVGLLGLVGFGFWEWKGTRTGFLHHDLWRAGKAHGRTFSILLALMFIEAVLLFCFVIFYPVITETLFTTDPVLLIARTQPAWVAFLIICPFWGILATKTRNIKYPLAAGYLIYTAGVVGLATIQPGDNFNQLAFAAVFGIGFACPLVLIIAGVQLSTPHHLIATATAVCTTTRAIGATIFTAIYGATLTNALTQKLPSYIAKAAIQAGLPASSIPAFIGALSSGNQTAIALVPHVSPVIIEEGVVALQHAYADSLRLVYIVGAPFGALAVILCFFLDDLKKLMIYRVDAPLEKLKAKHDGHEH